MEISKCRAIDDSRKKILYLNNQSTGDILQNRCSALVVNTPGASQKKLALRKAARCLQILRNNSPLFFTVSFFCIFFGLLNHKCRSNYILYFYQFFCETCPSMTASRFLLLDLDLCC